jgi:hypothetical protein
MGRYWRYTLTSVFCALALLAPQLVSSATAQKATSRPGSAPAPEWVAWRVFQQSLAAFVRRSPNVNGMLRAQFGLTEAESSALLNAGQSFLTAVQNIDTYTKAELLRRYPARRPDGSPPRNAKTLMRREEMSLRERAMRDGLYSEVEGRKQAALSEHMQALRGVLNPGNSIGSLDGCKAHSRHRSRHSPGNPRRLT